MSTKLTLGTDSAARKNIPVYSGFLAYFPAAVAGAAKISKLGNDKHNPGESLHHARGKSMDHSDCVVRHGMDIGDMEAAIQRQEPATPSPKEIEALLVEADQMVWRACAWSQELHEKYGGAPLAPKARMPAPPVQKSPGNKLVTLKELVETDRTLGPVEGCPCTACKVKVKAGRPYRSGPSAAQPRWVSGMYTDAARQCASTPLAGYLWPDGCVNPAVHGGPYCDAHAKT